MYFVTFRATRPSRGKSFCRLFLVYFSLNSLMIDGLGSWCLKVGGMGKGSLGQKEVSMATLLVAPTIGTITQLVEYLPTNTYQNWG